jgi:signal transduction histidine kinase
MTQYEDSLLNKQNLEIINELEARFETEQKEKILAEQQLQLMSNEKEIEAKRAQNQLLIFSILLMTMASVASYLWLNQRKKQEVQQVTIKEQEKGLQAIFEATENERQRIARELHDGIGQQLAALKMNIDQMATEQDLKSLDKVKTLAVEAAEDARSISHEMMPKSLTENGLVLAMEDLLQKSISHGDLHYEFEHFGMHTRLPAEIELPLYRSTQELLSNVIKHAQANTLNIQLIKTEDQIQLLFEDDGIGIPQNRQNGLGLMNIKSRIKLLSGTFSIENAEPHGTICRINIPLK